jgi:hypothetical protein
VRALRSRLLLVLLVLVVFIIIVHVLFMLVLFDGLGTHHVMIHAWRYLRAVTTVVLLVFFLVFAVLIFTHLLLVLLLVFLKHHQLFLLLLLSVEYGLRGQVPGEVSSGGIQAVVVLGRQQKLFLLIREVSIRVEISIAEDGHVLLEFADLREVAHEGLGDLLHQQGLVSHVEQDLLLLLCIGTLQVRVLLSRLLQRLLLTLC